MRTKEIIREAAFELMESSPFEKITIQQILDKAGISRRTFYKYYADKYEIMQEYFTMHLEGFSDNLSEENWKVVYENFYEFIWQKRSFFLNMTKKDSQDGFWRFLNNYLVSYYLSVWKSIHRTDNVPEREKYKMYATASASIALVQARLDKNNTLSSKEFAELSYEFLPPLFS